MVGLNQGVVSNPAAPFGGIKQSGLGREGGAVGHRRVPRDEVHRHRDALTPLRADGFGAVDGLVMREPVDRVVHVRGQQPVGEFAVALADRVRPARRCSLSRTSDLAYVSSSAWMHIRVSVMKVWCIRDSRGLLASLQQPFVEGDVELADVGRTSSPSAICSTIASSSLPAVAVVAVEDLARRRPLDRLPRACTCRGRRRASCR